MTAPPPIPRATYRLQLHAGFDLHAARALVPYLDELGISHVYCSPLFAARPGSTHGYDVVDHDRINPELGGPGALEAFSRTLTEHGMGLILDIVPNHVGIMGRSNPRWLDVLENGRASPYADFFDIDWSPLKDELRGKVLLPVLGAQYGDVLDGGELALTFDPDAGAFSVDYYEHRFAVDPATYPRILGTDADRLAAAPALLQELNAAFAALPDRDCPDADAVALRIREKARLQRALAQLCSRDAAVARHVEACVTEINGEGGDVPERPRLHALLEIQAYRPAYWRTASDEVNYRRFFDINDLAGLRMERPEVFEATHALVLRLLAEGRVQGLRVDHPDGLYDPRGYLERLQARAAEVCQRPREDARTVYLVVEKILGPDERLAPDWPVHGTTGYDFAALMDGLQVDASAEEALTRAYRTLTGAERPFAETLHQSKRLILDHDLSSELHMLADELNRITEADPHTRDYTRASLHRALAEVVACFPIYRSYVSEDGPGPSDREHIGQAVDAARRRSRAADTSVFDFVRNLLLGSAGAERGEAYRRRALRFTMRLQQYTGPVTAKGLEDTALYRYHRLVSLNEVGGAPERFGLGVEAFHRRMLERRERWPDSLLAASTHDSKRSDDLRARLHVLSEVPEQWEMRVQRWARINAPLRQQTADGDRVPDADTEYLLYQTLVGCWPLEPPERDAVETLRGRVGGYMLKAVREAKEHTSWINPDEEYERLLETFVHALLDPTRNAAFMEDFLPLVAHVARPGLFNSLSRTLIRLTAPGVPDTYQGEELWCFSLVDPDNRRPVDYARRSALLRSLESDLAGSGGDPSGLLDTLEDGRAKLHLIRSLLAHRRLRPELFARGDYLPLAAAGIRADHLCGFARRLRSEVLVSLAPRLTASLGGEAPMGAAVWQDTSLEVPGEHWRNLLTGEALAAEREGGRWTLRAGLALGRFPVAALQRVEGTGP